jgi:hypothetical protein
MLSRDGQGFLHGLFAAVQRLPGTGSQDRSRFDPALSISPDSRIT